ncbi:MAG: hypothetical protein NZ659_16315, partial [Acidimicrobiales bacterium]|nr:hypothetical protein [Acidimicrobiales bacterium]
KGAIAGLPRMLGTHGASFIRFLQVYSTRTKEQAMGRLVPYVVVFAAPVSEVAGGRGFVGCNLFERARAGVLVLMRGQTRGRICIDGSRGNRRLAG